MKRDHKRDAPSWVECGLCMCTNIEQVTFVDCPDERVYDGDDMICRYCEATATVTVSEPDHEDADHEGHVDDWTPKGEA